MACAGLRRRRGRNPQILGMAGMQMARGYRVRRNKPYAGGYIAEHYGAPAAGRHVVQVEVNRALYMDEARLTKLANAAELAQALKAAAELLAARAVGQSGGGRWAAE